MSQFKIKTENYINGYYGIYFTDSAGIEQLIFADSSKTTNPDYFLSLFERIYKLDR